MRFIGSPSALKGENDSHTRWTSLRGAGHDHLRGLAGREAARFAARAREELARARDEVVEGARAAVTGARRDIENGARIVIGLGPGATLRRGFALVRDDAGRPVTAKRDAARLASFVVEFRDGPLTVENRESSGGDRP